MCVSPNSPEFDRSMQELVECGLAIARGAADPEIFFRRADALWVVRDVAGALADFGRALEGSPPLPPEKRALAFAARAICQHQLGRAELALADVNASLALVPRAHAYALRSLILFRQDRFADALADANLSVTLDPLDWEARAFRGGILRALGEYALAIDDFTWVIESGECHKYASQQYLERAQAHLALGNAALAEADCSVAIDEDYHEQAHWPFIVRSRVAQAHLAYLVRAEARLALGVPQRALGDCFHTAGIMPGDPAVYALRARVYYALGNLQEAMLDLARVEMLRTGLAPTASTATERAAQTLPTPALAGAPA